jgi:acyl-CoA dehydrogenase
MEPSVARDRLTHGMYVSRTTTDAIGRLEDALGKVIAAETLERRLVKLVDDQPILHGDHAAQVKAALDHKVLSVSEAELVRAATAARRAVIAVDDFSSSQF